MPEMTPLRNNPPQSLAQPMRQAYDYWQEVPWHKRKKPKNASCKSYQQRKKGSASLCLACTPPQPGQFPAITRMQKLSAAQEATFARRVPPPTRGRFPLLPVCKSYQQCARPTAGPSSEVLGYIYLLIKGSTAPEPPLAVGRQVIACSIAVLASARNAVAIPLSAGGIHRRPKRPPEWTP